MSDGINDAEGRRPYDEAPEYTKEVRKIRARLNMQMNKLIRMERKFAKQADLAARPYRQKAHKIHKAWVKLYKHYTHVAYYTPAQIRRIR